MALARQILRPTSTGLVRSPKTFPELAGSWVTESLDLTLASGRHLLLAEERNSFVLTPSLAQEIHLSLSEHSLGTFPSHREWLSRYDYRGQQTSLGSELGTLKLV